MGGEYGLSLSGSSSATSGLEGNLQFDFGDSGSGGFSIPKWTVPVVIVGLFLTAIVWVLRK